jgi:hypothetical protein
MAVSCHRNFPDPPIHAQPGAGRVRPRRPDAVIAVRGQRGRFFHWPKDLTAMRVAGASDGWHGSCNITLESFIPHGERS